jgi:putative membrane protein (TIGR04086 family)
MSLRPVVSKPNFMALGLAIVAMVLTYVASSVALNSTVDVNGRWFDWLLVSLVSYVVSGVVVGFRAKRSPLMHGALLGVLVMGLFAGIQLADDPSFSWTDLSLVKFAQQSIVAMIACSVGALLGDHLARR